MATASANQEPTPADGLSRWAWFLALLGQFLFVFAVLALTGPGRIDITDGQVRYEVARGLIDWHDVEVHDSRVWFAVFPGRDDKRFTDYRLPQSLLGAVAIWLANLTEGSEQDHPALILPTAADRSAGAANPDEFPKGLGVEGRRQFIFVLTSAFAGACLAIGYSICFRPMGLSARVALPWASAGIFCTPNWFYATSTFDDILGATVLVLMAVTGLKARKHGCLFWTLSTGLLAGLAFHCKQPLGAFVLVGMVLVITPGEPLRGQLSRVVVVLVGFATMLGLYVLYQHYRYPMGLAVAKAPYDKDYVEHYTKSVTATLRNLLHLAISPSAGVFWYCPTLLLTLAGLAAYYRKEKMLVIAIIASSLVVVVFIATLTYFKGDPAWGPRYLTPIFALFWLFAPSGAPGLGRRLTAFVLTAGIMVQLLAVSVDPHRLYFERGLPSAFYFYKPWLYMNAQISHLVNRPREILEIAVDSTTAEAFSPSPSPTYGFLVMEDVRGRMPKDLPSPGAIVLHYHILNSYRPWWCSQRYLPPSERPVNIASTVTLLLGLGMLGLAMQCLVLRKPGIVGTTDAYPPGTRPLTPFDSA